MIFIFFKIENFAVDQQALSAKRLAEELLFKLTQVSFPTLRRAPNGYRIQGLFTGFQAEIHLLWCRIIESNSLGSRLIANEGSGYFDRTNDTPANV